MHTIKNKVQLVFFFIISLIILGCNPIVDSPVSTETSISESTETATLTPTLTASPTFTTTPTDTSTPTATPTQTASPTPTITSTPKLPVGLGTPCPHPSAQISANTITRIRKLADYEATNEVTEGVYGKEIFPFSNRVSFVEQDQILFTHLEQC